MKNVVLEVFVPINFFESSKVEERGVKLPGKLFLRVMEILLFIKNDGFWHSKLLVRWNTMENGSFKCSYQSAH